jgi:hypothetical protein
MDALLAAAYSRSMSVVIAAISFAAGLLEVGQHFIAIRCGISTNWLQGDWLRRVQDRGCLTRASRRGHRQPTIVGTSLATASWQQGTTQSMTQYGSTRRDVASGSVPAWCSTERLHVDKAVQGGRAQMARRNAFRGIVWSASILACASGWVTLVFFLF